ncbi:hypothetical protein BG452_43495 [Streptomyces sp. CBMA123]|nr:hypothetical protein [Streptomyces sp. CBMA123]
MAVEPLPVAVGAGAPEGSPWAVGVAVGAGAPEGSPWAVGVAVGAGVEVPVAAVAMPPAVAMAAAVAVAAMSILGRMRMNPCPFLRASG